jgi:hypothetical protein
MNNLYQGGVCNPNALATSNQYKRLMNNMMIGGQNSERLMQMGQVGQNFEEDIKNREMMFQAMNQGWGNASNHCIN